MAITNHKIIEKGGCRKRITFSAPANKYEIY